MAMGEVCVSGKGGTEVKRLGGGGIERSESIGRGGTKVKRLGGGGNERSESVGTGGTKVKRLGGGGNERSESVGRTGAVGWGDGFCFCCSKGVVVGSSVTFCTGFDTTSPGTTAASVTSRGFSAMVTVFVLVSGVPIDNASNLMASILFAVRSLAFILPLEPFFTHYASSTLAE